MSLISELACIWERVDSPFLIHSTGTINFSDVLSQTPVDLSCVKQGDVVAIIGDFDPASILTLLRLVDLGAVIVPLTKETTAEHDYFFEKALVDVVVNDGSAVRRCHKGGHHLIDSLRCKRHAGLVFFSTGTTGRPKAILHDMTLFLGRFRTPRPTLRTMSFLLFDHIGGINTLLHTLYNKGVVVSPESRTVESVLSVCERNGVELLPTTPTFLRLMLMSGAVPDSVPASLKVITYGTERMDQPTLDQLCNLLPNVDFRQTYGMSELGIVRVKSENRNSLFMKIGGEGVETRVVNDILQIRSESCMLGYLNAIAQFDDGGWYDTKDVVVQKGGYYKVVGRVGDIINVAGLKFMASEVERVALMYPGVTLAQAYACPNPITGQHVELLVQPVLGLSIDRNCLKAFLEGKLQPYMVPRRIRLDKVGVGHRFKREK